MFFRLQTVIHNYCNGQFAFQMFDGITFETQRRDTEWYIEVKQIPNHASGIWFIIWNTHNDTLSYVPTPKWKSN